MKINLKMPEDLIRRMTKDLLIEINNAALTKQVGKIEDKNKVDLIDSCLNHMSESIRVYDEKFDWGEIFFILHALKWSIYESGRVVFSATYFVERLLEFDSYDDLLGEAVEPTEYTINIISKVTEKESTSKINIYALLYLLCSCLYKKGNSNPLEQKKYIKKYLKLSR